MAEDTDTPVKPIKEAVSGFAEKHKENRVAIPPLITEKPVQIAAAVLFLEMVRADFDVKQAELHAVAAAIEGILGLEGLEADELLHLAQGELSQNRPVHELTRVIDETCSLEQKKLIVEYLWLVAFADAELDGHEEYLVRKVAELLHVPLADFLDAKIRARDRFF